MTTRNSGPAFPQPIAGMTLRDWFAAHALAGMLAYPGDCSHGSWHTNASAQDVAASAYDYADAMLAEREHGEAP
ncbi:MAG TPA: hypothetical protein VF158_10750 [Longimicrobiales bacterium]